MTRRIGVPRSPLTRGLVVVVAIALPLVAHQLLVARDSRSDRTFTYSVLTRGTITADIDQFAASAERTYADPRGWKSAGVTFRRVERGGDFSLFLAAADTMRSFGLSCSSDWSCRVGRNVVINQDRWLGASKAWNEFGLPLSDYRVMVINHETGHWLGHGHIGCGGVGQHAPVMMQQSKGLRGCRGNPYPLPGERWTTRGAKGGSSPNGGGSND